MEYADISVQVLRQHLVSRLAPVNLERYYIRLTKTDNVTITIVSPCSRHMTPVVLKPDGVNFICPYMHG